MKKSHQNHGFLMTEIRKESVINMFLLYDFKMKMESFPLNFKMQELKMNSMSPYAQDGFHGVKFQQKNNYE
jgi:hypothetical protein